MIVYKEYTQETLDAQYNARASVPDFPRVLKSWKHRSEVTRQKARLHENLAYGTGEREVMDIFASREPSSSLLVFFHGGYWQALDKRVFHFIADDFVEHGIAVAIVNYPLAPAASMDEIVDSCRRAMAWVYRHACEYDCDRNRLFACGHSAGGHITAMLMATAWDRVSADLPTDLIRGGCTISGLFDLHPIRLSYLNGILGMDEATAQRNSPLHHTPACGSPVLVSVGEMESKEFLVQSEDFAAAWYARGVSAKMMMVAGANHFSMLDHFADSSSELHTALRLQIESSS